MDVENLSFAVLDRDHSEASFDYALNLAGSRYFTEQKTVRDYKDLDRRMRSGKLSMVVEIPPQFGKKLEKGDEPEIGIWVDGAMPSRAETINGYVEGMHSLWEDNYSKHLLNGGGGKLFDVETRYRYNPDVKSLPAMVPGMIPILLLMIPAILSALAVVREKENGSIINLYVTPLTRTEFILGKQAPYIIFSMLSAVLLVEMAVILFDVPLKGSVWALALSLLIYSIVSTGMGLLFSSVTKSQIAVIFLTMLGTTIPAVQLCGMMNPVDTQVGVARFIGEIYPTTHMLLICRGVFNKALDFAELTAPMLAMTASIPVILGAAIMLQKKQES
jgi:ribosome-dependent ATPase